MPAEDRLYACRQLPELEGLGQAVVRTGLESLDAIFDIDRLVSRMIGTSLRTRHVRSSVMASLPGVATSSITNVGRRWLNAAYAVSWSTVISTPSPA